MEAEKARKSSTEISLLSLLPIFNDQKCLNVLIVFFQSIFIKLKGRMKDWCCADGLLSNDRRGVRVLRAKFGPDRGSKPPGY